MKNTVKQILLLCGVVLGLAALPAFAQEKRSVEINKRPLQDFVALLKEQIDAGKVDLTKSFAVELEGVLTRDGKFDLKKSKYVRSEGDAQMLEIAKKAILAVNDSGYFAYLSNFGVEKVNFILAQDEKEVSAIVKSEVLSAEKAKTIASAFNLLISAGKAKDNVSEDEKVLLDRARVTSEGKNFSLNFAAPTPVVHEMIKRKLENTERKETLTGK